MCQTIFLAKILGLFITIIALFLLTRRDLFQHVALQVLNSSALVFISGCFSLLFGLYILLTCNAWKLDYSLIITLLGWLLTLQGFTRIFHPHFCVHIMKLLLEKQRYILIAWVWLVLGLYLSWNGFTN